MMGSHTPLPSRSNVEKSCAMWAWVTEIANDRSTSPRSARLSVWPSCEPDRRMMVSRSLSP